MMKVDLALIWISGGLRPTTIDHIRALLCLTLKLHQIDY